MGGFFGSDSNTSTQQTSGNTIAPNSSAGSLFGAGPGVGNAASIAYTPGGVVGSGSSINALNGGLIDQSLHFDTSSATSNYSTATQTTPTVNVGSGSVTASPGISQAGGGGSGSGTILGLTYQAWAFIAGAGALITWLVRRKA